MSSKVKKNNVLFEFKVFSIKPKKYFTFTIKKLGCFGNVEKILKENWFC